MAERLKQLTDDYSRFTETGALAYDPRFDIQAYRQLANLADQIPHEEYQRRKNQLETRTRHNLETALGERFNVEISQIAYTIEDGSLKSQEHDEPFLEVLKRGQRYRQANGSNETEREKAEVTGFEKVEELLGTRHQALGTKIVIISPRGSKGSIYQHNFFDVYQKQPDGTVLMSRYTSKLTYGQFWQAACSLDNQLPQPIRLTDAYFLAHPITTDKSLREIIQMFHPNENTMSYHQYQKLIEACTPIINAYLQNPNHRTFNALLNFADKTVSIPPLRSDLLTDYHNNLFKTRPLRDLINFYGSQPVRQVITGCGSQGGSMSISNFKFQISNFQPYSVADFGILNSALEDQYGTLEIHCEECGATYLRDHGKLEKNCRHCGGTKGIVC